MAIDLLSLSSGERFIFTSSRIIDNFLRVSAVAFFPVCALLIFFLVSSDIGGGFLRPSLTISFEFWLAVTIFTLLMAYGPMSLWRAIWYSLAAVPRCSKWPESSQILSHSSNVNSNAMPRRLAPAFCTRYLFREIAIRLCGIVNTPRVRDCKWPCSGETLHGRAYLKETLTGGNVF